MLNCYSIPKFQTIEGFGSCFNELGSVFYLFITKPTIQNE